jgi:vacuolar iron transporter family protein
MRPSDLLSPRDRLGRRSNREHAEHPGYIRDAVLGAVDGTVTTFAVVAGAIGASLAPPIVLVLGMANLLADGLSMGVSNYLGIRADAQAREQARTEAFEAVTHEPEVERENLRAHYADLGLPDDLLDGVVDGVTATREGWIATIMEARFGPDGGGDGAVKAGFVTFLAFAVAGAIPLLTFVGDAIGIHVPMDLFLLSAILTAITFFAVGVIKGIVVGRPWLTDGLETLALGGAAAFVAFGVGWLLRGVVDGI